MTTTKLPPLVYMDGLNFISKLFGGDMSYWDLPSFQTNVTRLVNVFRSNHVELVVFIDASRFTKEAIYKYQSRRERDIVSNTPRLHYKETLLGDAFRKNDIPVLYSHGADNDDTIAAFAQQDGAAILSQDQDYFRYNGRTFPIYQGYTKKKGVLQLIPGKLNTKRFTSKRNIIPIPDTIIHSPSLADIKFGFYRGNADTPLLKIFGNPNIAARPLRLALYSKLGIHSPITEIFPIWVDDKVEWTDDIVQADPTLIDLLSNPEQAVTQLMSAFLIRPSDIQDSIWENHIFGLYAVIFNICAMATNGQKSLLSYLINFRPSPSFVYTFKCCICHESSGLTQKQVTFFNEKRYKYPKRCFTCIEKSKHI
ncbi:hypothetical protein BC833DRAFT_649335 [Globomyces pollinis-pini]|nr:hypothetical protein BC833DRAFT_649335 [Globomyces pollinis-pini]KAJ2998800.1 hypothetical protein HDV02_004040 [Globomyces sp. JEL0801]